MKKSPSKAMVQHWLNNPYHMNSMQDVFFLGEFMLDLRASSRRKAESIVFQLNQAYKYGKGNFAKKVYPHGLKDF